MDRRFCFVFITGGKYLLSFPGGTVYIGDMVWYYGFVSAFVVHTALSFAFPDNGVLIPKTIYTDGEVHEIEGDTISIDEKEKDAVKERSL
jgi:hypothetical protein